MEVANFDLDCARRYVGVIREICVRRKSLDRPIGVQALELGLALAMRKQSPGSGWALGLIALVIIVASFFGAITGWVWLTLQRA